MTLTLPFDNSYARLPDGFFARTAPTPVAEPRLIAFNEELAQLLGLTGPFEAAQLTTVFSGNTMPSGAEPLAQLYAGHQFGNFSPQLGDGRALLLGETIGTDGVRRDIQLKGSGPTPFSRRGDGRAWLGPVLREYVVSEAMHAMGVPTTRALAAVATGEEVIRERPLPGAVLTRVARSHLRVGTFQVFSSRGQLDELQRLFEFAVDRHYPDATDPSVFLSRVIHAQADLIAHWMSLGFIHGVMNTDNCAISGETIDYGPCAFLDSYNPNTVYSSIDRQGRYAYAAQADIIVWNMAQLATALIPLMPDADAAIAAFQPQINAMPDAIRAAWRTRFGAKIGLRETRPEDAALITDLLKLMQQDRADFTNTFRALSEGSAKDQLSDTAAYDLWHDRWQARLESADDPQLVMRGVNPARIPRNHRMEQMISAATTGDYALFDRWLQALRRPFDDVPEFDDLRRPPNPDEVVQATFCGT